MLLILATAAAMPFLPAGPWRLELRPDRCVLSRAFGDTNPAKIDLKMTFGSRALDLVVETPGKDEAYNRGRAKVTLFPSSQTYEPAYYRYGVSDVHIVRTSLNVPPEAFEAFKAAREMTIKSSRMNVSFVIDYPAKALTSLSDCQDDLLKSWHVDPGDFGVTPAQPGDLQRAFGDPSNYPAAALAAHMQGMVVAVLKVSSQGVVDECRAVVSVGAVLDEQTCRLFRQVTFSPAKNQQGTPIAATTVLRFNWSMPTD